MESARFDTSGGGKDDESEDPPLLASVEEGEANPHAPKKVSVTRLSL